MSKLASSIFNLRTIDDLSEKSTIIHRLHPITKIITTIFFLVTVISFGKYEFSSLIPFVIYPIIVIEMGELPYKPLLSRFIFVLPLIICIAIVNPIFEREVAFSISGIDISYGMMSSLSILIKTFLTVISGLLLVATTPIHELGNQLVRMGAPKIFVQQLLLVYRYITVLIEEALLMFTSYQLRAPNQKGIKMAHMGTFVGQLLLRSFDRAERVYQAMKCRGFNGYFSSGRTYVFTSKDGVYMIGWSMFFILARMMNIPEIIGFLLGVKI